MKKALALTAIAALTLALAGCALMDLAAGAGLVTPQQADSITKGASAVGKALEKLTPENEYYIGRSVSASLLKAYKPYDKASVNDYVNRLGQALAAMSDKPETFAGYHFVVLDTEEINAFAAPGGFILVSRGLIRCCKTEDALASVLAHEVAHVQGEDGINAIEKSRLTAALTTLGVEAAKNLGGEKLAQLTTTFEGSITDITGTLANKGYSRKLEFRADAAAVAILKRTGYSPSGLKDMLTEMGKTFKEGGPGFLKTHPSPQQRLDELAPLLKGSEPVSAPAERQARFQKAIAGV